MKSYPVTKLNRLAGVVLDDAVRGPVELTHRGRRKYVLMPADHYDALAGRHDVLAINLASMSTAEADLLIEGLAEPAPSAPSPSTLER